MVSGTGGTLPFYPIREGGAAFKKGAKRRLRLVENQEENLMLVALIHAHRQSWSDKFKNVKLSLHRYQINGLHICSFLFVIHRG